MRFLVTYLRLWSALVLLLVGTTVSPGQAQAQTPTANTVSSGQAQVQTPTANDEAVPRQLVLRLLGWPGSEAQLFVGRLPDRLPVELPFPDGAKVLGSLARNLQNSRQNFEILLDVIQSPEQAQAFYRERLQAAGWHELPLFPGLKGFTPPSLSLGNQSRFCKGTDGPSVSIAANAVQNAPTDVRLNLNVYSDNSKNCEQQQQVLSRIEENPLPNLSSPPNTRTLSTTGGGGSSQGYDSKALLETELNGQTLAADYAAQLKQASWTSSGGGQSGPMTWSSWNLKDRQGRSWQGMLSLLKVPQKPNQYFASVTVFRL